MNLYEIKSEIDILLNQTDENGEITEEAIAGLMAMQITESDKLENTACYIKNLNAEITALKNEQDALYIRRIQKQHKVDRLKTYLSEYMQATGKTKFEAARAVLSFRESKSLSIIDEKLIPKKYYIPMDPIIDNATIKEILKSGGEVKGAMLEIRQNLQIK